MKEDKNTKAKTKAKTNSKSKKNKQSKIVTITLVSVFIGLLALVIGMNIQAYYQETKDYEIKDATFNFSGTATEYVGINEDQIIRITKDGITAYNIEGEEIWTDTFTMEHVVVRQREPYIAISDMHDHTIYIFDTEGKSGEINLDAPVVYFSVNQNGDVAVIEALEEGHHVTAYDKRGTQMSGARVTYIKNAGYPISAEVSNDGSMLIASYIDIYNPQVSSIVVGMPLGIAKQQQEQVDNISYGIEIANNLVYDIEFVSDDTWVAIGDDKISYHTLNEGTEIGKIEDIHLVEAPYTESQPREGYLPILGKYSNNGISSFGKQFLWHYDAYGMKIFEKEIEARIDYFRADESGVIIGYGNDYQGYDSQGRHRFNFTTTHKIEALGYINHHLVAITNNDVYKLEVKEEGAVVQ